MNPYEAMEHPWLSKQRGNEQRESQQQQNVQHFTVKEMNTGDILNKFKLQTEKFNLVNRSAVRFSSFIKTKSSNEEYQSKICAQKVFFVFSSFFSNLLVIPSPTHSASLMNLLASVRSDSGQSVQGAPSSRTTFHYFFSFIFQDLQMHSKKDKSSKQFGNRTSSVTQN